MHSIILPFVDSLSSMQNFDLCVPPDGAEQLVGAFFLAVSMGLSLAFRRFGPKQSHGIGRGAMWDDIVGGQSFGMSQPPGQGD